MSPALSFANTEHAVPSLPPAAPAPGTPQPDHLAAQNVPSRTTLVPIFSMLSRQTWPRTGALPVATPSLCLQSATAVPPAQGQSPSKVVSSILLAPGHRAACPVHEKVFVGVFSSPAMLGPDRLLPSLPPPSGTA